MHSQKESVRELVDKLASSEFDQDDDEGLTDRVLNNIKHVVPTILEEAIYAEQKECKVDATSNPNHMFIDRSQPFWVTGTQIKVKIPFEGDPDYFDIQPNISSSAGYPTAEVTNQELIVTYQGEQLDGPQVKTQYQGFVAEVNKYLGSLSESFRHHNTELRPLIRQHIAARREKITQSSRIGDSLGIPIKKHGDIPTTYTIPLKKRERPHVEKQIPASSSPQSEPTLADEEYKYILSVLKYMAEVMEKHPKDFEQMGEETLRTQFLVQLNGQYKGQATGETFNYSGKTDILLNVEGKNVFIAECKIWGGEVLLLSTIDQLLSYLGWRDTKAAILIFNRNKNFTSVLETIRNAVPSHPCFVRSVGEVDETTFTYIFQQPDDPQRQMTLTVLSFDVPSS